MGLGRMRRRGEEEEVGNEGAYRNGSMLCTDFVGIRTMRKSNARQMLPAMLRQRTHGDGSGSTEGVTSGTTATGSAVSMTSFAIIRFPAQASLAA